MGTATGFIAIYLSILVWPAITILLKEIHKNSSNNILLMLTLIFLTIYWYCFVVTLFASISYVSDIVLRYASTPIK